MKPIEELTLDELIDELSELDDPEDACVELMRWGRSLPLLESCDKIDANRFDGCRNNVWFKTWRTGHPARIWFRANSDSQFVNGLILILMVMYNGKTGREILDTDAREVFRKFGLERRIGSQRQSGLMGMVSRLRQFAAEAIRDDATQTSDETAAAPKAAN